MNFVSITLLVLSFFSNAAVSLEGFGSAPVTMGSHGTLVPDSYVVTFKDVVSSSAVDAHYQWLEGQFASSDVVVGGKKPGVAHKYHIGDFQAYSGVFSKGMVEVLRKRGEVASVLQDQYVSATAPAAVGGRALSDEKQFMPRSLEKRVCKSQTLAQDEAAGEWGLGRISHLNKFSIAMYGWPAYPYDDNISFCSKLNLGGGIAYVIDSGIFIDHPEFKGRAKWGYKHDPMWPNDDVCGHGTHVAGIIGGQKYGVQKEATLIAVKVLEGSNAACQGTWAGVIAGLNWTYNDAVENKSIKQSVINMSLSGPSYKPVSDAVGEMVKRGLTTIVSAGNQYGNDACNYSPANAPGAITVGATDISDRISVFSNSGCCIDIYAPGTNIGSAYLTPEYRLLSGTSMAAPFVAGVVLHNKCRLGNDTPAKDLDGVVRAAFSINDKLDKFNGCPKKNKMVYNRATCK